MYRRVKFICDQHETLWNGIPAFAEAYDAFSSKIATFNEQMAIQEAALMGVAARKKQTEGKVIDKAIVVSKVLSALALKSGDTELMARNLYSRSEWKRGNVLLRLNRFQILRQDITDHTTELADYGIDQVFIDAFDQLLDEYAMLAESPRLAIIKRKQATSLLDQMVREIDVLLGGQLDMMMEQFRNTAPEFFNGYFNARIIIDIRGRRLNSDGTFTQNDAESEPTDNPDHDDGAGDDLP